MGFRERGRQGEGQAAFSHTPGGGPNPRAECTGQGFPSTSSAALAPRWVGTHFPISETSS